MNILLFSMPDSFEHMPAFAIRLPNGALTSYGQNIRINYLRATSSLLLILV